MDNLHEVIATTPIERLKQLAGSRPFFIGVLLNTVIFAGGIISWVNSTFFLRFDPLSGLVNTPINTGFVFAILSALAQAGVLLICVGLWSVYLTSHSNGSRLVPGLTYVKLGIVFQLLWTVLAIISFLAFAIFLGFTSGTPMFSSELGIDSTSAPVFRATVIVSLLFVSALWGVMVAYSYALYKSVNTVIKVASTNVPGKNVSKVAATFNFIQAAFLIVGAIVYVPFTVLGFYLGTTTSIWEVLYSGPVLVATAPMLIIFGKMLIRFNQEPLLSEQAAQELEFNQSHPWNVEQAQAEVHQPVSTAAVEIEAGMEEFPTDFGFINADEVS